MRPNRGAISSGPPGLDLQNSRFEWTSHKAGSAAWNSGSTRTAPVKNASAREANRALLEKLVIIGSPGDAARAAAAKHLRSHPGFSIFPLSQIKGLAGMKSAKIE